MSAVITSHIYCSWIAAYLFLLIDLILEKSHLLSEGSPFMPVSCVMLTGEGIWVELVGNTDLSITSNVLGDLQPIWFEVISIICEVLWNHHLKKNYKPPALPNWVQILFFEYVWWGYRCQSCSLNMYDEGIGTWNSYASTWNATESRIFTPEMISKTEQAEMGLLELQTRMLCTCWFARGCQNPRPATDL
jgi:hypothetical protein